MREVTILGIESSCDDTSAAVYKNGKILANVIANQEIHSEYGGVVPELASRAHQEMIIPVVDTALKKAGIRRSEVSAVACTRGPGLLGSLLVGLSFSKSFSMAMDIPLIEVNHMQAHILAHFIDEPRPDFPFLCLTVSGGHTQIVLVRDYLDMEIVGTTMDDAAGEAFDKVAKMLGLGYPGGPVLDRLAKQGNPERFAFPEPKMQGLNYSFSGLKTAVLYFLNKQTANNPDFIENNLNDICASVQRRIVTILLSKLRRASKEYKINNIAIAGGVSANSELRSSLEDMAKKHRWTTYIPQFQYCTDNAGMIAIAGYFKYQRGQYAPLDIHPDARLKF
ncbi:MAG: tRNA (adenosine(37)-N6)-threonylcarbamoyltransferase complex transferase subunit TsaD [Bacteroidetes bacterium]|nr:tRNA (adenosine(37)-N6)-threonylcarbamoyltransferase complex transferase subunit TsaD [Bacteroidota bacterium]